MNINFIQGNVMRIPLADGSVHVSIFSPPFWGLRDYQTAKWVGGDPDCNHESARHKNRYDYPLQTGNVVYQGTNAGSAVSKYDTICPDCGAKRVDEQLGTESLHDCGGWLTGDSCGECFVCHVRQYFKEIWRVIRDDGQCWINLGDSFASGKGTCKNPGGGKNSLSGHSQKKKAGAYILDRGNKSDLDKMGLKPKDLCGIPWRCALALQADGWWLRQAPPWIKANPMPESTRDRPNTAHEYWFMLTKSQKYYSDMEAVRQESTGQTGMAASFARETKEDSIPGQKYKQHRKDRKDVSYNSNNEYWFMLTKSQKYYSDMEAVRQENSPKSGKWGKSVPSKTAEAQGDGVHGKNSFLTKEISHDEIIQKYYTGGRHWRTNDFIDVALDNKINYLKKYLQHLEDIKENGGMLFDEEGNPQALLFNTKGYSGAHFATYNPDMIEPLIKFSTSERGVCPECGKQWKRVEDRKSSFASNSAKAGRTIEEINSTGKWINPLGAHANIKGGPVVSVTTIGWQPTCDHYDDDYRRDFPQARSPRKRHQRSVSGDWWKRVRKQPGSIHWQTKPAIVFDPFSGSGTTVMVANQLGRMGIGLELSMEYIELSKERTMYDELQAWAGGKQAEAEETVLNDLPLFGDI